MLKDLILQLKELEALGSKCSKCGMCQAVCPVFLQTGHEADVARGRLTLIDGLATDVLKQPDVVLERLNKCLLCGACSDNCSRGVNTLEIFIRARIIITGFSGLSFIKKIILQKIISNPVVFGKTAFLLQKYQRLFLKSTETHGGAVSARFYMPYIKGRNVLPLAPVSFQTNQQNKAGRELAGNTSGNTPGIFFFAGCLIDKVMPETGDACVKALSCHGCKPVMNASEGCCGMPSLASGDLASFNRLVEHNTRLFLDANPAYIVTACATCTFTIKELWPLLYKGDMQHQVAEMALRTTDISHFIVEKSGTFPLTTQPFQRVGSLNVTVHDPCHLKKSLNVYKEPRALLNTVPGLHIKEMNNADRCCGFGGTFSVAHYDLSSDIGAEKCSDVETSGASIVATGCPACMMQLKDQLIKKDSPMGVSHFMDLYAESLSDE